MNSAQPEFCRRYPIQRQSGSLLTGIVVLILLSALIISLLAWSYQSERKNLTRELNRELTRYSTRIDGQLSIVSGQLEAMRRWSGDILESGRTLSAHPLRGEVHPLGDSTIFSMDETGETPTHPLLGNIWGTQAGANRSGAFERELAMALWSLPLLDNLRRNTSFVHAVQYSSTRLFALRSPYQTTDAYLAELGADDMDMVLNGLQETDLIQLGRIQTNPERRLFWLPPYRQQEDSKVRVIAAIPVNEHKQFRGVISAEMDLSMLRLSPPRFDITGYSLTVSTRNSSIGESFLPSIAEGDILFSHGTPRLSDNDLLVSALEATSDQTDLRLSRDITSAPWRVQLVVPVAALQRTLWLSLAPLLSMSILAWILAVLVILRPGRRISAR